MFITPARFHHPVRRPSVPTPAQDRQSAQAAPTTRTATATPTPDGRVRAVLRGRTRPYYDPSNYLG